jgi:hypothetical protein
MNLQIKNNSTLVAHTEWSMGLFSQGSFDFSPEVVLLSLKESLIFFFLTVQWMQVERR